MRGTRNFFIGLLALIMAGCTGVNCPLTNTVYSHWSFYSDGQAVTVQDTLYVYAKVNGKDSLLINQLYNASSMDLPFSYYQPADTFIMEIHQLVDSVNIGIWKDRIIVSKDNLDHFNSPECGIWHEHNVTQVQSTSIMLDSVQVVKPKIDTNEDENFRIYFK